MRKCNRTGAGPSSESSTTSHQATKVHQHLLLPFPQGAYFLPPPSPSPPWFGTRWRMRSRSEGRGGQWVRRGSFPPSSLNSSYWSCPYLNASSEHQKNKTAATDMRNLTLTNKFLHDDDHEYDPMTTTSTPMSAANDNNDDVDQYGPKQQ